MKKIIWISTIPLTINLFCRRLFEEISSDYDITAVSSPGEYLDAIGGWKKIHIKGIKISRNISPLKDILSIVRLLTFFNRKRPEVVHSITPKAGLLSMLSAKLSGVPIRIHTFTGLLFPTASGLKKFILSYCDKVTCSCATHIIAEGEGIRTDLINNGITKKKIHLLGYGNLRGIDLDYYKTDKEIIRKAKGIRQKINVKDDTTVFLFVGRIVKDKGIEELIDAFYNLLKLNYDIRLLIVGKEDNRNKISGKTRKLIEVEERIITTDCWIDDVRSFYVAGDVFVFPSYREGFPNVVLEAGAMGLPAIVTDINGSREIIKNGENGLIISPKNKSELFNAMKSMIIDKSKRFEMRCKARESIASRFEINFVQNNLKKFYNEVIS